MSLIDIQHREKADCLAREGNMQDALECYNRALKENPDNDVLINNKAIALISLGRYEEALAQCRRAASLNPDSVDIWTNMGVVLERLNRLPEAADALEHAIEINPYECYARAILGIVYQKLNQEDRAEAMNRKLQELMFPNEYAGFFFGTAAFLLGLLLGGIRGIEGKPFFISISSQVVILIFFCILCILYWKSLFRMNEINRQVVIVPCQSNMPGDRSIRGMYIVLAVMIIVFGVGIFAGSDIWNLMH